MNARFGMVLPPEPAGLLQVLRKDPFENKGLKNNCRASARQSNCFYLFYSFEPYSLPEISLSVKSCMFIGLSNR